MCVWGWEGAVKFRDMRKWGEGKGENLFLWIIVDMTKTAESCEKTGQQLSRKLKLILSGSSALFFQFLFQSLQG